MKDFNLLIWLTQLGLSVAIPLAGFDLAAVWLHQSQGWGSWILWVGILLGVGSAIVGLRNSLKILDRITRKTDDPAPPVSFHDHD